MDLIDRWAKWDPGNAPFIFDEDRSALASEKSKRAIVSFSSWQEAYKSEDFCKTADNRLHLGLLPFPFCGDLSNASIYILLLNPGLGPHDYYGEYEVQEYRDALLGNLKQQFSKTSLPFIFLDPKFSWHGGFGWWHNKFARIIQQLSEMWSISFATARNILGQKIACIELFPYHSSGFYDANSWLKNLPSVKLARAFVEDFIVPRVRSGAAITIATRQTAGWNLPDDPGFIKYNAQQARAAHMTPGSPGGIEIINFFNQIGNGAFKFK